MAIIVAVGVALHHALLMASLRAVTPRAAVKVIVMAMVPAERRAAAVASARIGDGARAEPVRFAVMALPVVVPITKAGISSKPLGMAVMEACVHHQAIPQ